MSLLPTVYLDFFYPVMLITCLLILIGLLAFLVWDMKRLNRMEQDEKHHRDEWLRRIAGTDHDDDFPTFS